MGALAGCGTAPATVAPATVAPATVAPATVAPATVAPAAVAPATVAPAAFALAVDQAFDGGVIKVRVDGLKLVEDVAVANVGFKRVTLSGTLTMINSTKKNLNQPKQVWIGIPTKGHGCEGLTLAIDSRDETGKPWCVAIGSSPSDGFQVPAGATKSYPMTAVNAGASHEYREADQVDVAESRSLRTDVYVCLDTGTYGGYLCRNAVGTQAQLAR
jgi:hypothetical protein